MEKIEDIKISKYCSLQGRKVSNTINKYMFIGLDVGAKPKIVKEWPEERCYLMKVPGHSGWSGIGSTSYYGATYYLYWLDNENRVSHAVKIDDAGKQWKKAVEMLIEYKNSYKG